MKLYERASGGDTITNAQIFEGVYLNGQSTESRTVLSALPFSKKNNKKNRFEPHAGGFYIGYTRLSNDFLSFNLKCSSALYVPGIVPKRFLTAPV